MIGSRSPSNGGVCLFIDYSDRAAVLDWSEQLPVHKVDDVVISGVLDTGPQGRWVEPWGQTMIIMPAEHEALPLGYVCTLQQQVIISGYL